MWGLESVAAWALRGWAKEIVHNWRREFLARCEMWDVRCEIVRRSQIRCAASVATVAGRRRINNNYLHDKKESVRAGWSSKRNMSCQYTWILGSIWEDDRTRGRWNILQTSRVRSRDSGRIVRYLRTRWSLWRSLVVVEKLRMMPIVIKCLASFVEITFVRKRGSCRNRTRQLKRKKN